jgi:hypothetical protein
MSVSTIYPLLSRVVAAAVNISQKSANILRDIKASGELNIKEKEKNDYVTKADFQSQLNIIKSLENLFPKLKLCGEEGVISNQSFYNRKKTKKTTSNLNFKDLKDEYNDLETTLNEEVLRQASTIPEIYNQMKEEEVQIILYLNNKLNASN